MIPRSLIAVARSRYKRTRLPIATLCACFKQYHSTANHRALPIPRTSTHQQHLYQQRYYSTTSNNNDPPSTQSTPATFRRLLRDFRAGRPLPLSSALPSQEHIYANNDCPLQHITHYGFDYDYTLAHYTDALHHFLYENARLILLEKGYPLHDTTRFHYTSGWAIRGLHFDSRKGYLLKLDQFGKIQTATVFCGRKRVSVSDIIAAYDGITITKEYESTHMHMMTDLFCLAECMLLSDIIQLFVEKSSDYSAEYIYRDVTQAISLVHSTGKLHNEILNKPHLYLSKKDHESIKKFLLRLKENNKITFLLTNSAFNFVNGGLSYILGENWKSYFDIIICSARKPKFWSEHSKFRLIDLQTNQLSFTHVNTFEQGQAYTSGGLFQLMKLSGATGTNTLYFGDNTQTDLIDASESALWRTVSVISELSHEIKVMSSIAFQKNLLILLECERLIVYGQTLTFDQKSLIYLKKLKKIRKNIRTYLLELFNPNFGSVFRTAIHRTKLFFEVSRFADVYTSKVSNFLNYPIDFCFYAKRTFLAHEYQEEQLIKNWTKIMNTHGDKKKDIIDIINTDNNNNNNNSDNNRHVILSDEDKLIGEELKQKQRDSFYVEELLKSLDDINNNDVSDADDDDEDDEHEHDYHDGITEKKVVVMDDIEAEAIAIERRAKAAEEAAKQKEAERKAKEE